MSNKCLKCPPEIALTLLFGAFDNVFCQFDDHSCGGFGNSGNFGKLNARKILVSILVIHTR